VPANAAVSLSTMCACTARTSVEFIIVLSVSL
jgi:hypothetical protein